MQDNDNGKKSADCEDEFCVGRLIKTITFKRGNKDIETYKTNFWVFIFLFCLAILIQFCFIKYAIVDDVGDMKDVSEGYLDIYCLMVGVYTIRQKTLEGKKLGRRLPGSVAVFMFLISFATINFLYFNGWYVERVPQHMNMCTLQIFFIYFTNSFLKTPKGTKLLEGFSSVVKSIDSTEKEEKEKE